MTKGDIAKTMWQVMATAYNQGGRTRVDLPVGDALDILASLMANVLAQVPAAERHVAMGRIEPMIARMVKAAESRPNVHVASRGNGLILP